MSVDANNIFKIQILYLSQYQFKFCIPVSIFFRANSIKVIMAKSLDRGTGAGAESPFGVQIQQRMGRCVGEGVSSKVYAIGKKQCVKIVCRSMDQMRESELEYWKRCNAGMRHECLVEILDCRHNNLGQLEVTMPLYWSDLGNVIHETNRRQLTVSELQVMHDRMIELADAIRVLHSHSFFHFDIKPQNVLVADERLSRLVLTDFGLSRAAKDDGRQTIDDVSTLWYRAPEILELQLTVPYGNDDEDDRVGRFDARPVDMWALGAVYSEWLHGRPIFLDKAKVLDETLNDDRAGWSAFLKAIRLQGIRGNISVKTRHTNIATMRETLARRCDSNTRNTPIFNITANLICRLLHVDPKMRMQASDAVATRRPVHW